MDREQRFVADAIALAHATVPRSVHDRFVQGTLELYVSSLRSFRPDISGADIDAGVLDLVQKALARLDEAKLTGGATSIPQDESAQT